MPMYTPPQFPSGSSTIWRVGSSSAQLINTATEVAVTGSILVLPLNLLLAGSALFGTLCFTTTSAGTAGATIIRMRSSTTGAPAATITNDPELMKWTFATASTGTPVGRIDIAVHVRTPGTATAPYGTLAYSKSGTGGWGGTVVATALSSTATGTFDIATANTFYITVQNGGTTPAVAIQTASHELQV